MLKKIDPDRVPLSEVDLRYNNISDEGALLLAKVLGTRSEIWLRDEKAMHWNATTLQFLCVDRNRFGPEGRAALMATNARHGCIEPYETTDGCDAFKPYLNEENMGNGVDEDGYAILYPQPPPIQ